jgi:DUF3047 family protein
MRHLKRWGRLSRAHGLWGGAFLLLAFTLWGGEANLGGESAPAARPMRHRAVAPLRAAMAEAAAAEAFVPPEDGKEPRHAVAIPLPPVLPQPRIDISVAPDGGNPVPHEWSLREFTGKARVKVEKVGNLFAVRMNSDRASFSLFKDVEVDVSQYPFLTWAWRVDRLPPDGDVRRKETDDQAAQLYVIFPRFPEMVRSQIIGYIWDSTVPAGTVHDSPSDRKAKIVVLRSGTEQLGRWVVETRNVLEDYGRLFGGTPPKVGRISLLINSQHTKSAAESWFSGLVFTQVPLKPDLGWSADPFPARPDREMGRVASRK